jgi:LysR family transcriptional regulator, nitrogen assimilation regulatory protein
LEVTASIRDIRLFVAAYEERSFTAAATREGATQSGVSQHIRKLEGLLKLKLFTRNKTGISTTPAADAYYHRCIELLRVHGLAHSSLGDFTRGLNGELCIGMMPSMTRCVLAPALASFIEEHPNVAVRVVEGYSGTLTKLVKEGELEFAIVPAFTETVGLKSRLLAQTPEVLVSRKETRTKSGRSVKLSDLGPLKLVVPGKGNARRQLLDAYFAFNGVHVERVLELDAMFGTLAFVSLTDWAVVLPAVMMSNSDDSRMFNIRIVRDPPLLLELMLIEAARRPMSRPGEVLLGFIKTETERLSRIWTATTNQSGRGRK